MAKRVMLRHPVTGVVKAGAYGFSWTYLFFGFLVPMYRGELVVAALHLLFTIASAGISQLVFPFVYNRQYMQRMLEAGYVLHDDERVMAAAREALGMLGR